MVKNKIQKLIDEYVGAENIIKITDLVDIFNKDAFNKELEKVEGTEGRADTIANRTRKAIHSEVIARAPLGGKYEEIRNKIIDRAPWIAKQHNYFSSISMHESAKRYVSGESHRFLGKQYRLKIVFEKEPSVEICGQFIRMQTRSQ